ncbi:predicted protein [Naegleria gruberi]|uniref:Predicted protein n=1 Tax=Naegleria gruberi TaxID=5762 RepID=D2VGI2_NAEGR|nr:uncharacterized protein NAEGRDRAFT_79889 [Naegleria gruberi]EFC43970.1 predicted protein [Naegleria gruberi]|eukprot:XP_002676714.1 predicted protein [Naegleria gruberi strain NEG-M]
MQSPQFWLQDVKPKWLPEGFQVPTEMMDQIEQLTQEAQNAYYSVDKERNGFLRRREFKKAMKKLGINKFEAKHMLILVDQERLKVVSIKNYVNAYLFIKSGGLNHEHTDYQGPITTGVDKREHLLKNQSQLIKVDFKTFVNNQGTANVSAAFITQNGFTRIPRGIFIWLIVNLKNAATGMFLCSENGKIVANRPAAGTWETFTFYNHTDWADSFLRAFKTVWNTYLCCEDTNILVDNRANIGDWEKFEAFPCPGGYYFKSWTGKYISGDASGNVSMANSVGLNEAWDITILGSYP